MAKHTDIHVGGKLRARRLKKGLTQTALAEKLGLSFQQIQKYETGANRISASKMWDLGLILDVRPEYFFDGLEPHKSRASASRESARAESKADNLQTDLNRYFLKIRDPQKRRRVVYLVRSIANLAGIRKPAGRARPKRKVKRA